LSETFVRTKPVGFSPTFLVKSGKCFPGLIGSYTEKSEDISMCKEMPVISVNKVVDNIIIIGKRRRKCTWDR
jgi:hypothetical protein